MSNLKLQKRLASSILNCGIRRVWMDEAELSTIAMANSRQQIKKLVSDGIIIRRPIAIHSTERHKTRALAKQKGRHRGRGKRKGTKNARLNSKWQWIRRIRVLRRTLVDYRQKEEIDSHLYHKLYLQAKGNQFRNKRVLMEHIRKLKIEQEREKAIQHQIQIRRERSRRMREKRAAVK